jgi:RNA polymerase sigma-70 factor (ECF subfamily)
MTRPTGNAELERAEAELRALLLAAIAGDAASYRRFLARLTGHLRAYFRRRLAPLPDEVEDLVQETLLAIHCKRHTYRPDEPLTAWVYAIARYKLVDLLRSRASRAAFSEPWDDEQALFAACDDEASLARRDLEHLLRGLPAAQREAIERVKLEGHTVAEASRLTGQSPSAVKVGVHRGLKALAAKIRRSTT